MSESTQANVFAWDADAAPWATLKVTAAINVNTVETFQFGEAGVDECAWLITQTQTGTGTHEFTFTRESPAFDDFIQTANKWALVRGIGNGGGLTCAASDGSTGKGSTIRTIYTQACGATGPDGALQFTDSTTFALAWSQTYTFNGTGDAGTCSMPSDSSGTDHPILGCNLLIVQSDDSLAISGAVLVGAFHFPYSATSTTDTAFTTPVTITLEDFKKAGGIDFGSTQLTHDDDPGYFDTFAVSQSIGFVCS